MNQQPFLDFAATAPPSVTMSPTAREARKSGLRVARAKAPRQMNEYRACLQQIGPASDQEVARVLGWQISSVCGRRNDWRDHQPGSIGSRGRVQVTHPDGTRTSRPLWTWVERGHDE
jgi:hypothetical protein